MTDHNGTVLSTQKYWPYGAVRSGSLSQTDKLYTDQQVEPGDSALGQYNLQGAVLQHDALAVRQCGFTDVGRIEPVRLRRREPNRETRSNRSLLRVARS